ncbi:MAG: YggS family pyridoxal phosphate-dependent enzyme [Methylophilaceae bacterium]|jgi:pyridoxal phosphate enzyme (YggS family)|uniref:YggS family pyridoxal phosphate-dependent enzyme n=1 Tax=Methylobacillus sp. MM3 TaxID=1848039 RepID=UPI0007E18C14|nr:YggS family pyridoxal phosphate-dependent enzyme [Methylobacillus sp. MM3]OAJ69404.1 YggS family pyridoxal phosphate enzyme [Methylobacillus sp. MM3]
MTSISERLQAVKSRLRQAETEAGRAPESVTLIAVSKTQPADAIREAHAAGQYAFGENYLQESLEKMAALADLPLKWHFIGPIQSNKTRPIAENFAWVHGVDRLKIAQRLSDARPAGLPPLNICIEVNVSGEESKGGVEPNEVQALADAIAQLPGLKLRGLMAIPAPTNDIALQRQQFRMLRELLESLKQRGLALDTLSMGMSEDFPAAIAEGATIVRIGTAIFGPRIRIQPPGNPK